MLPLIGREGPPASHWPAVAVRSCCHGTAQYSAPIAPVNLLLQSVQCGVNYYTVLYCTVLYCIILYCTILYYTVLYYLLQHMSAEELFRRARKYRELGIQSFLRQIQQIKKKEEEKL